MNLSILTPDQEVFNGTITSVKVPGISGQFEVLNNHAPLVASLGRGQVRVIQTDGQKVIFEISDGFIEVLRNEVSILAGRIIETAAA